MKVVLADMQNLLRRIYEAQPEGPHAAEVAARHTHDALLKAVAALHASHLFCAFEAGGRNWRHDLYPPYKSRRPPTPQAVIDAAGELEGRLRAEGVATARVPGVEADDVIATVARRLEVHEVDAVILSSDQGYAQLLAPHLMLYHPATRELRGSAWAEGKFGVPVDRIRDAMALVGNSADDIPGVPGIGPKRAAELLDHWGSIDTLLDNLVQIGGKLGALLHDYSDDLLLSRQLVTLRSDLTLGFNLREMKLRGA